MDFSKGTLLALLICIVSLSLVGCSSTKQDIPNIVEEVIKNPDIDDNELVPAAPNVVDEYDALRDLSSITIEGNGTEPFWNFSASGSTLVFNEPSDVGAMDITTETMVMSQNLIGSIVNIDGITIDIIVTSGTCNDGMSDLVYTHEAVMTRGSDVRNGCANVTP